MYFDNIAYYFYDAFVLCAIKFGSIFGNEINRINSTLDKLN